MELCNLSQTSKLFRSIAEPKLYERYFKRSEQAKKMDIRSVLHHPQFETLVNTLSLRLDTGNPDPGQFLSCRIIRLRDPQELPCSCDRLDEKLGDALSNLLNLKVLRLNCHFCQVSSYERHRYLANLQTKVLHEVKFRCYCSVVDEKRLVEYLGAPSMTPVTTLRWVSRGKISSDGYFKAYLSNSNILPNLRTLHYVGRNGFSDLLLRCRPIQRISSYTPVASDAPMPKDLIKRRIDLTHITIRALEAATALFSAIKTDPLPFRNLQHLGTFSLRSFTCSVRL
jgi:hypothetical protein